MANHLARPVHNGNLFDWRKNAGCACASDLSANADGRKWMGPLYDDACDLGFVVRSHRTGACRSFFLTEELFSRKELVGWKFRDEAGNYIVVFND